MWLPHPTVCCVLVFRDVSSSRRTASRLNWQATHDVLTGLPNRRAFEAKLKQLVEDAQRTTREHALLYMDLDQFKVVNDTCGHGAGDELLRRIAGIFRSKLRNDDMVARLGGDEFGVLLYGCSLAGTRRVADELCNSLKDFSFCWNEKLFRVGVSIGVIHERRDIVNRLTKRLS